MNVVQMLATEDRDMLEAWCRQRSQTALLGTATGAARSVCRVLGQYLMIVLSDDISMAPHLMLDGCWEMWATQAVARYVKPGMHCIDVGASFGYYTLLLAELAGVGGEVMAFEPHPGLCDCLAHSLELNGLGHRVTVLRGAAGRTRSSTESNVGVLYTDTLEPCETWVDTDVVDIEAAHPRFPTYPVKMLSVDQGRHRHWEGTRVDFVKIDVAGDERQVWQGMQTVIDENSQLVVMLQFYPEEGDDPAKFIGEIRAKGFRLGTIGHDGQIREISDAEAVIPDTGRSRMLWLDRQQPA